MKTINTLKLFAALWAGVFLPALNLSAADSPALIPFQGRLTDADGQNVSDGAKVVQFKIYDAPVGGTAVWAGEVHKLSVNGGLVNTVLGTKSSLNAVDFDAVLYLEITVDANEDDSITLADPPLLPRQSITPSVFTLEAADARKLDGHDWSDLLVPGDDNPATGKIKGEKIEADGSFTAAHMGADIGVWGNSGDALYSDANVGIGTSAPISPLHIHTTGDFRLSSPTGGEAVVRLDIGETPDVSDSYGFLELGPGTKLRGNGQRSTFEGRLGIGMGSGSPNPSRLLQVGDTDVLGVEGMIRLESISSTGNAFRRWDIGVPKTGNPTTSHYSFVIDDNHRSGEPSFMVDYRNGNVGIATSTPSTRLDVVGSTRAHFSTLTADGGNSGVTPGKYYADNSIVAWGHVAVNGDTLASYGVTSVTKDSDTGGPGGTYTITINATMAANKLIPTVTVNSTLARFATVFQVGTRTFRVRIFRPPFGNTDREQNEFYFTVTGR